MGRGIRRRLRRPVVVSIIDATFEKIPRLFQSEELLLGEECVVDPLSFLWPGFPGGDGDSSQVQVVADRVLEVVVYAALGEPGVQVLPKITGDGTWLVQQLRVFHVE